MNRSLVTAIVLCAGVLMAPTASAANITVTTPKDVLNNADHKCSLREAITAANADIALGTARGECPAGAGTDVIKLAGATTYKLTISAPDEDVNASGDLDINGSIELKGAKGTKIQQTQPHRVFDVRSGVVSISRVKITGGHAPDGGPLAGAETGADGGGIRNLTDLTLARVVLQGNRAGDGATSPGGSGIGGNGGNGGGIFNTGDLTIARSTVSGNVAGRGGDAPPDAVAGIAGSGGAGGGIVTRFSGSSLTITRSKVVDNTGGRGGNAVSTSNLSSAGGGGQGGGIESASSVMAITNTTVMRNRAGNGGNGATSFGPGLASPGANGGGGGGIVHLGAALTVTDSTIAANTTGGGGTGGNANGANPGGNGGGSGSGGGITLSGTTITVVGSTISNNAVAEPGPGGDGSPAGTPGTKGNGGGIQTGTGATLTIRNSTLSSNSNARFGGGFQSNGTTVLNNVTIANNEAETAGGIIRSANSVDADNTIIANNTAATAPDCQGTFVASDHNLVEDLSGGCNGFGGTDVLATDPKLGSLANNGGPTQTHALKGGSPAIDTGDPDPPDGLNNCEIDDQRGKARPVSPPKLCDIGAFEKT